MPARNIVPVYVLVIPVAANVIFPCTESCAVPAKVTFPEVGPAIVKLAHLEGASIVTVYAVALDPTSNITESKDVGIASPPAPFDDKDHLAVDDQLPVPPTQYKVLGVGGLVKNIGPELLDVFVLFGPT